MFADAPVAIQQEIVDPFASSAVAGDIFWPDNSGSNASNNTPFNVMATPPTVENNPNAITPDLIREVAGDTEPFYRAKMLQTIDAVEEYSWNRGELGGLDWGFKTLNDAFEGLNTGVHLVAGQSNIGRV